MRGRTLVVGSTLVVGIALAGCGSSKPTVTKEKFVSEANAICSNANATLKAAEAKFTNEPSKAELEEFLKNTFIPSVQGQIKAIQALPKPSGEEKKVTDMINLAQSELNSVKSSPEAFLSDSTPFSKFQTEAHAYGLTDCATEEEEISG